MSQNISPLSPRLPRLGPRDEAWSSKTFTSLVGLLTKLTPALSAVCQKDRIEDLTARSNALP